VSDPDHERPSLWQLLVENQRNFTWIGGICATSKRGWVDAFKSLESMSEML
jgi:hypothetical protein